MINFIDYINSGAPLLLDGAMGTALIAKGLKVGQAPETLNLTNPDMIASVHEDYIAAGARLIYANTFGANAAKVDNASELVTAAVKLAKRVAADTAYVALDIGPIGELFEPSGTLSFTKAYEIFREMAELGEKAGADVAVMETFSSLGELRAAVLAVKENTKLPIITTMTFEPNGRTFTGVTPAAFAVTMTGLGVNALGVNCSQGPKALASVIKEIAKYTHLPLVAKPNAGLPNEHGGYTLTADLFSEECTALLAEGVTLIGGCCGTNSEYISKLSAVINSGVTVNRQMAVDVPTLCSPTQTVSLDRPLIIGERLNPTGKKALKAAYLSGDEGYILRQAVEQQTAGASLLDINTGVPGVDEASVMTRTVNAVASVCSLPLSIDSSKTDAIEAGLRTFQGRALVNSVNGERSSLDNVLPLVKKYGAMVIGLCLDEHGVPKTTDERVAIAKKIVTEAAKYGIPPRDIVIDCLTLTVSAEPDQAMHTLDAIKRVKAELGVTTALGVSNISFGLPDREYVNAAFLTMALTYGLDLAIINPNNATMAYAFSAYNVIAGYDDGAANYIAACTDESMIKVLNKPVASVAASSGASDSGNEIARLIRLGLPQTKEETIKLLSTNAPLDVVNKYLIPALDEVGTLYESGKLFLPQLIRAAETAKLGFTEVKKAMENSGVIADESKVIVLATVKGDVHDIGKNIVKVVLENYGYKVIDLGKNTPIELIVDTVKNNNIKLLGLSALMTTTAENMRLTIEAVKAACPDCTIMVGGAVLSESYAKQINADYYTKDATASVAVAKKIFN